MNIVAIIFHIYLIIGFCVIIYDWYTHKKSIYDQAKKMYIVEDEIVAIYIIAVIVFWPIKVVEWLIK